jgi:hypothetical protein
MERAADECNDESLHLPQGRRRHHAGELDRIAARIRQAMPAA